MNFLFRCALAGLLVALLALGAPAKAPANPAVAVEALDWIVTLLELVEGVQQLDQEAIGELPIAEPGIKIESFSLKAPARGFNVGDRAPLNLRFSVSYGPIGNLGSSIQQGRGEIAIYVNGRVLETRHFAGARGVRQESRLLKAEVLARDVGVAKIYCVIRVWGEKKGLPRDQAGAFQQEETDDQILEIEPPYRVWIEGPSPLRVHHGDRVTATLKVEVRTQTPGEIGFGTQLEGKRPSRKRLPGAANPGAVETVTLVQVSKHWPGCPYGWKGRTFENLTFSPPEYELIVPLGQGKPFVQTHRNLPLNPVPVAVSEPVICWDGEVRISEKGGCECARRVEIAQTVPPLPTAPPSLPAVDPVYESPQPSPAPDELDPEPAPSEEPDPEIPAVEPPALPDPPAAPELPTDWIFVSAPKTALSIEVEEVSVHPGTDAHVYQVTIKGTGESLDLVVKAPPESPCRALGEAPLQLRTCGGEVNTALFWCHGRGEAPRHFEVEILNAREE